MTEKRIVAIGECMVEMAPTGTEGEFRMGFAGDTLNTAWYLRRALPTAWQVDYLTAVGIDSISGRMTRFLADAGLGTGHIAALSGRTVGLYLIELQDGERSFAYWRGQSAAKLLAADGARLNRALAGAAMIYFSGITLAILSDEDRARLLAALSMARANGASIAFDPNLRPRLWSDPETMCTVVMQAAALSDIALPSFEDEAAFFGDASPEATAERYRAAGVALTVVKNGAGEMLASSGGTLSRHAPEKVAKVVDSTAAGDSFNAGFLAAQVTGAALPDAIRAGARQATKVVEARGALVP
jgi:2-dehydro-3-deoxygluconokinase